METGHSTLKHKKERKKENAKRKKRKQERSRGQTKAFSLMQNIQKRKKTHPSPV